VDDTISNERLSGKGALSRKRTVSGTNSEAGQETGFEVSLDVDSAHTRAGRVLSVHGLNSFVKTNDGQIYECTVRGVLKSLATDLQHVVVAGDFATIELDPKNSVQKTQVIIRQSLFESTTAEIKSAEPAASGSRSLSPTLT